MMSLMSGLRFEKGVIVKYFHIDRTNRILMIEKTGNHLLCLRSRLLGKSLLLSMSKNYYHIAKVDEFGRLFINLAIGSTKSFI